MFPLDYITMGYIGALLLGGMSLPWNLQGGLWLAGLLAGVACLLRNRFREKSTATYLLLAGGGALVAMFALSLHQWAVPSHHLLRHMPRASATLIGHITRPLEHRAASKRPRVYIQVERLSVRGVEVPVRGQVRLTLSSAPTATYRVGDKILARRIRLQRPIRYRNPGAFNYREFLRLRDIHATAFTSPRSIELLARVEKGAFQRHLYAFRERMRNFLRISFPGVVGGFLEAITLGVREDLDSEVRESFRLAGASHILAISGLHVGFISAFFYFGFLAICLRLPPRIFPIRPIVLTPLKMASLATIPVVILFALLTGARVSTVRAAIMAVVYLLTRIFERPGGAMHSVLLAALLILLIEPGFIWDTGFQLSFIAVAAIILAARRLPRPDAPYRLVEWGWWKFRLLQFAGIQGVVSATMAPLTAFHFQEIQLAGLVTNFFLIPVASILVPLTFVTSTFAAGADLINFEWFGTLIAGGNLFLNFLASAMIALTRMAAAVPGSALTVARPHALQMALFLCALAAALGVRRAAGRKAGWAVVAASIIFIALPWSPSMATPNGQSALLLPDVGRKNIFFLRLPDGRGYAIDAGRQSRAKFDTWRNVLAPLLRNEGERSWEALILLARSGEYDSAQRELQTAMRLRRVIEIDKRGSILTRAPGNEGAEIIPAAGNGRTGLLWKTESRGTRLSFSRWEGHSQFLLEHGGARWLLLSGGSRYGAQRNRHRFKPRSLPKGKFDLVRAPERMLREEKVLDWLERVRPFAVIASPQSTRRLPYEQWQHIKRRQRALGVYRPWRGGMARASTSGRALGQGGRIERYAASSDWPKPSLGRWVRYYSGEERKRIRASKFK
ncbi:MAG: ComEC family competence protein [Nitrospinaceae bacterium]|nr:ComEC family competence protein [Nitrospinaceae bacterium]MBT5947072.1 ComEC family competence protein [Nitrospinaceae bacterium]MBT6394555.1 ComEC family competence protein [Nitrospinaceae bacterium]MBT7855667.1 ComEC family competence protein [Nitrospinaceae bacterium]